MDVPATNSSHSPAFFSLTTTYFCFISFSKASDARMPTWTVFSRNLRRIQESMQRSAFTSLTRPRPPVSFSSMLTLSLLLLQTHSRSGKGDGRSAVSSERDSSPHPRESHATSSRPLSPHPPSSPTSATATMERFPATRTSSFPSYFQLIELPTEPPHLLQPLSKPISSLLLDPTCLELPNHPAAASLPPTDTSTFSHSSRSHTPPPCHSHQRYSVLLLPSSTTSASFSSALRRFLGRRRRASTLGSPRTSLLHPEFSRGSFRTRTRAGEFEETSSRRDPRERTRWRLSFETRQVWRGFVKRSKT